jgi:hypothetical protein
LLITKAKFGFDALRSAGVMGAFLSFRFGFPSLFFLNVFLSFLSLVLADTFPLLSFETASSRDFGFFVFFRL